MLKDLCCHMKKAFTSKRLPKSVKPKGFALLVNSSCRYPVKLIHSCCGFASICNKRTTQLFSHSFPLPGGMGRRISSKKAKLVGWDENSLTEWQREKKTTINN